jgi:hypothetical protein
MLNIIKKANEISRQINDIRDTGPDTENMDHGSGYGFLGTAVRIIANSYFRDRCQPIRIENFEKPFNTF